MTGYPIGHVIANYDIDGRRSGYGRGAEDSFFPDIERLDGTVKRGPGTSWMPWVAAGVAVALLLGAGLWRRFRS